MLKLKAKRVELGIKQKDLANRINVTVQTLSSVENNKYKSDKLEKRILEELKKIEFEKFGISIPSLS